MRFSQGRKLALPLVLTAAVVGPFIGGEYWTQVAILVMDSILVAIAWNLLVRTGQISLGHAGFFGLGSYGAVLAFLRVHTSLPLAILVGGVVASLAATVLGVICLRMKGIYLAITTLAFAETFRSLAIMLPKLTEGSVGLSVPRFFQGQTIPTFLLMLAILTLTTGLTVLINGSSLGFAFSALRGNEEAASVLGIDPVKYKVVSFVISAFIAGVAGALYAFIIGYISPHEVFTPYISIRSQVFPLVGGLYTVMGPVIGGILLGFAGELVRPLTGAGGEIVYGIVLILCVLLYPRGVMGLFSGRPSRMNLKPRKMTFGVGIGGVAKR